MGLFGSNLTALERHSASVAYGVRKFKRQRNLGTVLLAAGAALAGGSLYQYASNGNFGATDPASALYLGGGAVAMIGLFSLDIGQQNLRAALDLYNQE